MNVDREVTSYLPVLRSVPVFVLNTEEGLTGAVPLCDRAGCDTVEGLAGAVPICDHSNGDGQVAALVDGDHEKKGTDHRGDEEF